MVSTITILDERKNMIENIAIIGMIPLEITIGFLMHLFEKKENNQ